MRGWIFPDGCMHGEVISCLRGVRRWQVQRSERRRCLQRLRKRNVFEDNRFIYLFGVSGGLELASAEYGFGRLHLQGWLDGA